MTKSFYTYFSIDDLPSQTISSEKLFLVAAICSFILFAICFYFRKKIKYDNIQIVTWALFSIGALSTCFLIYWSVALKGDNATPFERLKKQNNFFVVEGYITDFKIIVDNPRAGIERTIESFRIDTVLFKYNDYPMASFNSFHKTRRVGGILDNGMYARISYIDHWDENVISKIELTY